MSDLGTLRVWDDPAISAALSWYLDVAENRRPAKFRIAATLATELDPAESSEEALWAELDRLTPIFPRALGDDPRRRAAAAGQRKGRACSSSAANSPTACSRTAISVLGLPRRSRGRRQVRRVQARLGSRVSSHFHHTGEELFYRGTEGSGTIFFTSCNMRCAFCQNGDISTDKDNGEETDPRTLAAMAWTLRREGCHNINWVGGEVVIHLHAIVDAIALLGRDFTPTQAELARARKTKADRFFWFDEAPDAAIYDGQVQCADAVEQQLLHDAGKHEDPARAHRCLAARFQVRARPLRNDPREDAWYWETVTRNLALLDEWGEDFSIRHLVMPNHVECCTYPVLEWIAEHMPEAPVNVMAQFHPDNFCDPTSVKYRDKYAEIARRPTHAELDRSWRRARELGLNFETASFDRRKTFGMPAILEI